MFPEPAPSEYILATQGVSLLWKLHGLWTEQNEAFIKLKAEAGWKFLILSFLSASLQRNMNISSISLKHLSEQWSSEPGRHTLQKGVSLPQELWLKCGITARKHILVSYWVMRSEIKTLFPAFSEKSVEVRIIGPSLQSYVSKSTQSVAALNLETSSFTPVPVLFPLHYAAANPYNCF